MHLPLYRVLGVDAPVVERRHPVQKEKVAKVGVIAVAKERLRIILKKMSQKNDSTIVTGR